MAQPKTRRLATEKYADDAASKAAGAVKDRSTHTGRVSVADSLTDFAEAWVEKFLATVQGGSWDPDTQKYRLPTGGTTGGGTGGTGGTGGGTTPDPDPDPDEGTEPPPAPDPTLAPVYVETYKASAGTGADDTAALNAAFAAAAGKVVKLGAKTYRHSGQLNVNLDNVTIDGGGVGRLLATNPANCSLRWTGDNGTLMNVTVEGISTTRGVNYESNILLIYGADGFTADNVLSKGSAGTGIFLTRCTNWLLRNMRVEDSRADGFHITGGSSFGKVEKCKATRIGDDGFACVAYALLSQSDPGMVHHVEFTDCEVRDQTVRGRGFTVVGGEYITYRRFDSDGTWGPGIYVASEPYGTNPTHGVAHVQYLGGTLRRAHSTTEVRNGAILIAATRPGNPVVDVLIQDVNIYDTRPDLPFEIGAYAVPDSSVSQLRLQNVTVFNGSRGDLFWTGLPASAYSLQNVTRSTGTGTAAPVMTSVRVTSMTLDTTTAVPAWAPTTTGTDGVKIADVTTSVDGGTPVVGPATGSRTITGLAPASAHSISIQPRVNGASYGPPVVATFTTRAAADTATVLTSDSFNGDGPLVGRATDVGGGGITRTWEGDPAIGLVVSSGRLIRATNADGNLATTFAGVPTRAMDVSVTWTITSLPTGDTMYLDVHRATPTVGDAPNTYRAAVAVTGALRLTKRLSGVMTDLGDAAKAGAAAAGDAVTVRYSQGRIELLRNGVLADSVADTSITSPGYAGVAVANTCTGLAVDNMVLLTAPTATGSGTTPAPTTPSGGVVLASDDYARADSTTIGSTPVGGLQYVVSGYVEPAIIGGQVGHTSATGLGGLLVDTTRPDIVIEATLAVIGTGAGARQGGLAIRGTDAGNMWWLSTRREAGTDGFEMYRIQAGSPTRATFTTGGPTPAAGQRLRVTAKGRTITAYVDGVQVAVVTDAAFNETATMVGYAMGANGLATRWDNLTISTPA